MSKERILDYCLSKPFATEDLPFDNRTWTAKIGGKIFLIMDLLEEDISFNVKCDPEKALLLRAEFPENVMPGYHMNKKHWNTIKVDRDISWSFIKGRIDDSYDLVWKSLTKKIRESLTKSVL